MKKIIIILSGLFLILIVSTWSITIPTGKPGKNVKKILGPEEARVAAEKFINENLLPPDIKATVKGAILENNVYSISLNVQGKDYTSYMTRDGGKFFQSGLDMATYKEQTAANQAVNNQAANQAPVQPTKNTALVKTDKPKVELFVMTYCPYGLQAEKGILPAFAALDGKIDASVKFVHYFLHGDKEEQETYTQACIRDQQTAKFNNYLQCFIEQGDSAACQTKAQVNQTKLNDCVASKSKDYYKTDSVLSQQYGVQGSPTLVINGVQSNAGRDAASYLAGICAAFNQTPAECSKQLSSASPAPGFGTYNASN
ncbi:hypothetical protein A3H09_03375 [Candidatus Falkowbacteria bacterium RIFCSPLOWO2_12_FULL_45_13]|uniref:Thioredoxin-like fold domain-containing protein n=2 Tax=Candidatus Falkowiibacteriota TaxID=1752728 RepID=A0A1F5SCC6_9BACT|nr:MAG: hypothetical protein A3H66_00640 [Candidatus Falkowbacteria bacterium RIFCSPLOWO2_02_FULL_45_21]OGF30215.1 MAG: hypothetical protein A3H09_03375 [Candidatus Falkowbacteria bacterium RIFCSPLOWO2_12_FULL_45_13]